MSGAQANALVELQWNRRRDWRAGIIIIAVLSIAVFTAMLAFSGCQQSATPTGFVTLRAAVGQEPVIVSLRDIVIVAPSTGKDGRVYGAIQVRGQKGLLIVGDTPTQVQAAMKARR